LVVGCEAGGFKEGRAGMGMFQKRGRRGRGRWGVLPDSRLLADVAVAFGEDDQLLAREIIFFDRLADNFLADAVGIDIRRIPKREIIKSASRVFTLETTWTPFLS